jgi:hypothetical protein
VSTHCCVGFPACVHCVSLQLTIRLAGLNSECRVVHGLWACRCRALACCTVGVPQLPLVPLVGACCARTPARAAGSATSRAPGSPSAWSAPKEEQSTPRAQCAPTMGPGTSRGRMVLSPAPPATPKQAQAPSSELDFVQLHVCVQMLACPAHNSSKAQVPPLPMCTAMACHAPQPPQSPVTCHHVQVLAVPEHWPERRAALPAAHRAVRLPRVPQGRNRQPRTHDMLILWTRAPAGAKRC